MIIVKLVLLGQAILFGAAGVWGPKIPGGEPGCTVLALTFAVTNAAALAILCGVAR